MLTMLPLELLLHVYKQMDITSASRLANTAWKHQTGFNTSSLWQHYLLRDFGIILPLHCEPKIIYKMLLTSRDSLKHWKQYFVTVKTELDTISGLPTENKSPEELFSIIYRLIDCQRIPEFQIDIAIACCVNAYLNGLDRDECTMLLTTTVDDEKSTKRSEPLDSYPALNGINVRWLRATEEDKQKRSCLQFAIDRNFKTTLKIMSAKQSTPNKCHSAPRVNPI